MLLNYCRRIYPRLPQLASVAMRLGGLGMRFLLLFLLARHFSVIEVGLFSLYWAAIQLGASVFTLDVYSYSTRSILSKNSNKNKIISKHIGFLILVTCICTPIAGIAFYFYSSNVALPLWVIILFLIHLPLEIFNTDAGRLLVPLEKPLQSNFLLFIRTAAWIPIAVLVMELNLKVNIGCIVALWVSGSLLCLVLSYFYLKGAIRDTIRAKFDILWLKSALLGSFLLTLSTILFRAILGLDRFYVGQVFDLETVAIYSLYASVSLGVLALVESGVSAWRFPQLIKNIHEANFIEAKKNLVSFIKENFIASFLLIITITILFPFFTRIFLNEIYYNNIITFYLICLATFFYCISMPFHYVIYGFRKDIYFILIYGFSLFCMSFYAYFFMESDGFTGTGIMILIGLSLIGLGRLIVALILLISSDKATPCEIL